MAHPDLRGRPSGLPPLLVHIIHAAIHAEKHDPRVERDGEADALAELGRLAGLVVPARGVLVPADSDLYKRIGDIATAHLGFAKAKANLRSAVKSVEDATHRDAIESAHIHVMTISETAYYYAGLAWGVTFAEAAKQW
jgi:hypothetical protein